MANINISFTPEPGYTGTYVITLYKTSDLMTPVGTITKTPPFSSPVIQSFSVTGYESYYVKVVATRCNKIVFESTFTPSGVCAPVGSINVLVAGYPSVVEFTDPIYGTPSGTYYWEVYDSSPALIAAEFINSSPIIVPIISADDYTITIYQVCGSGILSTGVQEAFTVDPL